MSATLTQNAVAKETRTVRPIEALCLAIINVLENASDPMTRQELEDAVNKQVESFTSAEYTDALIYLHLEDFVRREYADGAHHFWARNKQEIFKNWVNTPTRPDDFTVVINNPIERPSVEPETVEVAVRVPMPPPPPAGEVKRPYRYALDTRILACFPKGEQLRLSRSELASILHLPETNGGLTGRLNAMVREKTMYLEGGVYGLMSQWVEASMAAVTSQPVVEIQEVISDTTQAVAELVDASDSEHDEERQQEEERIANNQAELAQSVTTENAWSAYAARAPRTAPSPQYGRTSFQGTPSHKTRLKLSDLNDLKVQGNGVLVIIPRRNSPEFGNALHIEKAALRQLKDFLNCVDLDALDQLRD